MGTLFSKKKKPVTKTTTKAKPATKEPAKKKQETESKANDPPTATEQPEQKTPSLCDLHPNGECPLPHEILLKGTNGDFQHDLGLLKKMYGEKYQPLQEREIIPTEYGKSLGGVREEESYNTISCTQFNLLADYLTHSYS